MAFDNSSITSMSGLFEGCLTFPSLQEVSKEFRDDAGLLHREDGLAVVYVGGMGDWWWHGEYCDTQQLHEQKVIEHRMKRIIGD